MLSKLPGDLLTYKLNFILANRTSEHSTAGRSPAELMFGHKNVPDFIYSNLT